MRNPHAFQIKESMSILNTAVIVLEDEESNLTWQLPKLVVNSYITTCFFFLGGGGVAIALQGFRTLLSSISGVSLFGGGGLSLY